MNSDKQFLTIRISKATIKQMKKKKTKFMSSSTFLTYLSITLAFKIKQLSANLFAKQQNFRPVKIESIMQWTKEMQPKS